MGYRALLKNYIRHLMRVAGTNFIEEHSEAGILGRRQLAELRLLAAEVEREEHRRESVDSGSDPGRLPPYVRR